MLFQRVCFNRFVGTAFSGPKKVDAFVMIDIEKEQEKQRGLALHLRYFLNTDLTSFSVLSPEPNVRFLHRTLPDGSPLSLCTTETDYFFELLDAQRLL